MDSEYKRHNQLSFECSDSRFRRLGSCCERFILRILFLNRDKQCLHAFVDTETNLLRSGQLIRIEYCHLRFQILNLSETPNAALRDQTNTIAASLRALVSAT